MYTETLTQRLGICAAVNPQTLNNSSATTGSVDMQRFHRALFVVEVGAVTAGGSLNLSLIESATSNLANSQNPQGVGASTVTLNSLNTNNQQYTFEVRADQLDAGYRYVGLKVTETAAHNTTVAVIGFGDESNHKPGNSLNDASVATQSVAA